MQRRGSSALTMLESGEADEISRQAKERLDKMMQDMERSQEEEEDDGTELPPPPKPLEMYGDATPQQQEVQPKKPQLTKEGRYFFIPSPFHCAFWWPASSKRQKNVAIVLSWCSNPVLARINSLKKNVKLEVLYCHSQNVRECVFPVVLTSRSTLLYVKLDGWIACGGKR